MNLINNLKIIVDSNHWITGIRQGNNGSIGNTLEYLLGKDEDNLPKPDFGNFELKCEDESSETYTTLFHCEPHPRKMKFVPRVALPLYGWDCKTKVGERSFRQTMSVNPTDRGFYINVNSEDGKVCVCFDSEIVSDRHCQWLERVAKNIGLNNLDPQPYWDFDLLKTKTEQKLTNCIKVVGENRLIENKTYHKYKNFTVFEDFVFDNFIDAIKNGLVFVDFDARTGHNHGTKFRIRRESLRDLYKKSFNY